MNKGKKKRTKKWKKPNTLFYVLDLRILVDLEMPKPNFVNS